MENTYESLAKLIEESPKNIKCAEEFEQRFKDAGLQEELIKLYKLAFIYNSEPIFFEKIGDLYNELENYEEAINYYLNYCETDEVTPEIYRKLAVVFEKNNDIKSAEASLEFAKKLETERG